MTKQAFDKIKEGLDEALVVAPYVAEIERLREENARYKLTYAKYVEATDRMNGAPCEQIRHQQEVDALREKNARLREALQPFAGVFLFPDDLGFEHSEDIRSDPDWDDDANDMQSEDVFVLRRDIRRARAAIREGRKDG